MVEGEAPRNIYLIVCDGSTRVFEGNLLDAIREAARHCRGRRVEIYRAKIVASLEPDDLEGLIPFAEEEAKEEVAVVFDQMFKGFAEIVDRELAGEPVVLHEILGRGISRPIRVGKRLYKQPARDDYDILSLLEKLTNKHKLVVFFTGDKKLAQQARLIPGVQVEYLPPGEVTGKEHAVKIMVDRIKGALSTSRKR